MPGLKKPSREAVYEDLLRVYTEMGEPHTFTRDAYTANGGQYHGNLIWELFGSSSPGQVLGVQPEPRPPKAVESRLIRRMEGFCAAAVEERRRAQQRGVSTRPVKSRTGSIIAIGDLHMPWHSARWLGEVYKIIREVKPSHVIQLGDAYDHFAQSRFPSTRNLMTPKAEVDTARQEYEAFWGTIRKIVPQATCTQLLGNHDTRPFSRLIESAPSLESFVHGAIMDIYRVPGVDLIEDPRERFVVDNIAFLHGTGKLGTHAKALGMNVCRAHDHQPGIVTVRMGDRVFWEASAGYCAEPEAPVFRYIPYKKYAKWGRAVVEFDRGQPKLHYDLEDQR